jgi:hypothetical protein
VKSGFRERVQDGGHFLDALLLGVRGMVGINRYVPSKMEVSVEIFRIFRMGECKPMATLMITKMKKVITSDSEFVDPRI